MNLKIPFAFAVVYLVSIDVIQGERREIRRRSRVRHQQQNQTGHDVENVDDAEEDVSEVSNLLHKINDKLTGLSIITDQHLRKLDNLEYKITKMEVQVQEKTEGVRMEMKEMARRVQQLDWQSGKTEQALDILKSDTTFLKQALEHFRTSPVHGREVFVGDAGLEEVSNKLQTTVRGVQSLLNGVSSLQTDVLNLKGNVSGISNVTSSLQTMLPSLLTTKYFQRSLLDLGHSAHQPVCSLVSQSVAAKSEHPRDCSQVPGNKSGIYRVHPQQTAAPFFVFCDMNTRGGGWTVIQQRYEGTLDFYKGWHDYKLGFGNIGGEHWLGLEKIHLLTNNKVNELLIELEDFALENAHAHYTAFSVGAEVEGYPIKFLGGYDGTAGDSLIYHAGQKFSTFDMDHDSWAEGNCAQSHSGAWWYNGCDTSNLNGKYLNGDIPEQYEYQGMYWYEWKGPQYSLKSAKIMIKPRKDSPNEEDPDEK